MKHKAPVSKLSADGAHIKLVTLDQIAKVSKNQLSISTWRERENTENAHITGLINKIFIEMQEQGWLVKWVSSKKWSSWKRINWEKKPKVIIKWINTQNIL